MKKSVAASLSIIYFLLSSCEMWDEDSAGDQECDKYDQALDVGFATTSNVDSVQFWMNGIQVCIAYEYNFFQNNRGMQGFQGRSYINRNETCIKNCNSYTDSTEFIKKIQCTIGSICDNFKEELNNLMIKVYSFEKIDSTLLNRDGLAQMAYNKAYKVFPKSDSLLMSYFKEDLFAFKGCQGEFCMAELTSDSLLCVDSHSDSPKKEFKNICEERTFFTY